MGWAIFGLSLATAALIAGQIASIKRIVELKREVKRLEIAMEAAGQTNQDINDIEQEAKDEKGKSLSDRISAFNGRN